jgi:hypothetical protein
VAKVLKFTGFITTREGAFTGGDTAEVSDDVAERCLERGVAVEIGKDSNGDTTSKPKEKPQQARTNVINEKASWPQLRKLAFQIEDFGGPPIDDLPNQKEETLINYIEEHGHHLDDD